jgi:hypothetical protein
MAWCRGDRAPLNWDVRLQVTNWLIGALLRWGWRCVWWLSLAIAACALLFVFRSPSMTMWSLVALVLETPIAYAFFRAYLKALTSRSRLSSISTWYTVAVLYFGVAALPLSIIVLPLQWSTLRTDDISLGLILGGMPSGLAVAIAAAKTLDECRLVA